MKLYILWIGMSELDHMHRSNYCSFVAVWVCMKLKNERDKEDNGEIHMLPHTHAFVKRLCLKITMLWLMDIYLCEAKGTES